MTVIEGTTQRAHQWSAEAETPDPTTPDLMTALKAATDAIKEQRALADDPALRDDDAAIEDLIAWSLGRPADVGAERLRREAW